MNHTLTNTHRRSTRILTLSATSTLVVSCIGLWIFMAYVVKKYGVPAFHGHLEAWNVDLSHAHIPGDLLGNTAVALHLLLAILILGGGPLQLVPALRRRLPGFHRWFGRTYMVVVIVSVVSGLYMMFDRDIGSAYLKSGFVFQTLLILMFAGFTLRYGMTRQRQKHQRWALRFFIVTNIALFARVIVMIWVLLTGGVGIDFETGKGLFLDFLAITQFLPLLILEIYFRVIDTASSRGRYWMSFTLALCSLAILLGVTLLTVGMWFPIPSMMESMGS